MKYRTKLYFSFIGIVFCTTLVALSLVFWVVQRILFKEWESKVLTVAATAATGINGDALKVVQETGSDQGAEFHEVTRRMNEILKANRSSDLFVIWIYTVRTDPHHPKHLEIGIEPNEKDPTHYIYSKKVYPERTIGLHRHLYEPWVTPHIYTDRYGSFLSGFAPIFDRNGEYVATLGVDVTSKFIHRELNQMKLLVAATFLITLAAGFAAATFLAHLITRSLDRVSQSVQEIRHGNLKTRVEINSEDEFGTLAFAINKMAKSLEEHERLKLNFIRYVSKHVMEKILASDMTSILKGERRKITVLVSDIRKFTEFSEKLPPEIVVALLNEYLDRMLTVIFANNGTLDKFMGDGLLVEFGAPLDDESQEANAVKTALEMQEAMEDLGRKWAQEGYSPLKMGIGIHTGYAVVGNIGSEKRMEYTAVGNTISTALHLEQSTKEFGVSIAISETTAKNLKGFYHLKEVGSIQVSGQEERVGVYGIEIK